MLSIRWAEISGVRVHTVCVGPRNSGSRAWTFLSYLRLLLSARRRLKLLAPDVINAHFTVTHGVIAAFSGFHPTLLCAWGKDVIWDGKGEMPIYLKVLNRYALDRADYVSSTSKFMVEHVRALAPPGTEVLQVPFGVDAEQFHPSNEQQKSPAMGGFAIGFIKSLRTKYGPKFLIRAMPRILKAQPSARLIMGGEGPLLDELTQLAEELGVSDRVEFPGFIAHHSLPELFQSFDVFVNCSIDHSESFGVVILEASASGVPVVATRVGGVPEVCRDNETGLMVEAGDSDALARAIIRLAKDKALRKRMGIAGRRFVLDTYAWRDNVDLMLKHLESLAGESISPVKTFDQASQHC